MDAQNSALHKMQYSSRRSPCTVLVICVLVICVKNSETETSPFGKTSGGTLVSWNIGISPPQNFARNFLPGNLPPEFSPRKKISLEYYPDYVSRNWMTKITLLK